MCVTTERNSTICGHRRSFTAHCKKRTSTSILNSLRKCSPVLNSSYHFDLCHACRRIWCNQGVAESEAIERMREYRTDHNYHAPLSPTRVLQLKVSGMSGSLRRERDNSSTEMLWPSMADARQGTSSKPLRRVSGEPWAPRRKDKGKGVDRSIRPPTNRAENASRMMSSPRTLEAGENHAEIHPEAPSQAHLRPKTGDSSRTGLETIIIGMDSDEHFANSYDFEPGNVNKPLPLSIKKRSPERVCVKCRGKQPKPRLDLGKPLPRPPRADSPMPGRPFDSQNPERDLPANMYYPRFI